MLRSFISVVSAALLNTACGSASQFQVPNVITNAVNQRIARAIDPQYKPEAQVHAQSQGSNNPCPRGVLTGWQGSRPICALGQQAGGQNQAQQPQQQNGNHQEAGPCRSGTHQTGWQGTRRVCAPNGNPGQQGGGNFQAQQQQQNSNPSVAHPGFIAAHPGGYQYEGRTYHHQPTYGSTIQARPCRMVNTQQGPRQQC